MNATVTCRPTRPESAHVNVKTVAAMAEKQSNLTHKTASTGLEDFIESLSAPVHRKELEVPSEEVSVVPCKRATSADDLLRAVSCRFGIWGARRSTNLVLPGEAAFLTRMAQK